MTLDEAIKHAEEVMEDNLVMTKHRNASDPVAINCFECADEHRQLAEWLKELKAYKEQEPCDAISRQAVKEQIKGWLNYELRDMTNPLHYLEKRINELPSVRPQKSGNWKFVCQHWRKCSECGFSHKFAEEWEYCPNCGARMCDAD